MSKLMAVFEVINNTHIPVGVYDDFTTVTNKFADGTYSNRTHYIAVFPANTVTSAENVGKIAERMVIENLAKRDNVNHEYTSWFLPPDIEAPVEQEV